MISYTLKKIALTEFAIGKFIHSNWISDNPPKDHIPFNVYWEMAPIFYKSYSLLNKLQVWFYSLIIPFILFKILEPAILFAIAYWKPIILTHTKTIAAVISYGLMAGILIATITFMIRSISKSVSVLHAADKD